MYIFLDTANRELIKKWMPTGLIDGVTTNPSLLSKEGSNPKAVLQDICSMVEGPVSIEVVEKEPEAVEKQAREIASFAENVVVKIPCVKEYLPVIKRLADDEIAINVTLVFSPLQALLVAKLGVSYISPFLGRWDDIGVDGLELLEQTVALKNLYEFDSDILAASIRSVLQFQQAFSCGADVVTVPPEILEKSLKHPLTDRGVEMFDADWKKVGKKSLFE
jgi:transaldolase